MKRLKADKPDRRVKRKGPVKPKKRDRKPQRKTTSAAAVSNATAPPPDLDIYLLGAGASFVHGAPLTNQILPYALNNFPASADTRLQTVRDLLLDVFAFEALPKLKEDSYPSLVDVLSVIDMAIDRHEDLARGYNQERLNEVRRALDYAIFKALEHSLGPATARKRRRSEATPRLVSKLNRATSVIISFNYDVIINVALTRRFNRNVRKFDAADAERLSDVGQLGVDYGIEFANIDRYAIGEEPFKLLKLHGSFNWLWSRITGNVYFGGFRKSIGDILDLNHYYEQELEYSGEPAKDLEPILITPTHLKDLRNVHLGMLWRKAEQALREARRVTFIGYSLPPDDLHIKFLLKRAFETRRHPKRPSITVVDSAEGRKRTQVQKNYERFFGSDIRYYRHGFDRYGVRPSSKRLNTRLVRHSSQATQSEHPSWFQSSIAQRP